MDIDLRCITHADRRAAGQCDVCGDYLCTECHYSHKGEFLCPECFRRADSTPFAVEPIAFAAQHRYRRRLYCTVVECPECGGLHHYEVTGKIKPRVRPRQILSVLLAFLGLAVSGHFFMPGMVLLSSAALVLVFVPREWLLGSRVYHRLTASVQCPTNGGEFIHREHIIFQPELEMLSSQPRRGLRADLFDLIADECHVIGPDDEIAAIDRTCGRGHAESEIIGRCEACGRDFCRHCRRNDGGERTLCRHCE